MRNTDHKLLDLVFSDMLINMERCDDPLVKEDNYHPILLINICINKSLFKPESKVRTYNFRKANFNLLYELLLAKWNQMYESNDVNESCRAFYTIIFNIFDRAVPRLLVCQLKKYPKWFSSDLIKLIKEKNKAYKKK